MQTCVRGSKGQEQSIANRLQQTAATSGCSSPAPCYLARMQAHHYHIFRFFFFSKEAKNLVLSRHFPVCEYQWWLIECFQNIACSQRENGFLLCILYSYQQRLAEAAVGLCSQLPTPGSVRITEQGALLCWLREAPYSLLLLWTSFTAPFSTQKIVFRYRLCFGRESCTSNYADEWKAVTKYSTCLESQNTRAGKGPLEIILSSIFQTFIFSWGPIKGRLHAR